MLGKSSFSSTLALCHLALAGGLPPGGVGPAVKIIFEMN